jgi:hypothetical protein
MVPRIPILTCWENSIWVGKIKDLDQRLNVMKCLFSYSHLIFGVPNFDPHPFQGSEFMKTQMELGGQFLNPWMVNGEDWENPVGKSWSHLANIYTGIDKKFPSEAIPEFQKKHIGRRYLASCRYGTLAIVTVDDGGVGFVGPRPSKTNWFQVDELQKNIIKHRYR